MLGKKGDEPFRIVSIGIFPGSVKEHEQLYFHNRVVFAKDLGSLQFTFKPVFIGNCLGSFKGVVDKLWDRIVAWADAGGVGDPLTKAELFELFYAPYGTIPADPFPVTRRYFWLGILLAKYGNNPGILSMMYLSVQSVGGIATQKMLDECAKELNNMSYDIATFTNDLKTGVFSGDLDKVRALQEENKAYKSQLEEKDKALEEERKAAARALETANKAMELLAKFQGATT